MRKKSDDENGKSGDGSNPDLQKQSPSDPRSAVEKQGCSAETQPLRLRRLLRSLLRNFSKKVRSVVHHKSVQTDLFSPFVEFLMILESCCCG
ncbi:hypothetical protein MRB53_006364 [Persea americana]|uniref:Uncharacterized protein n=1 Tax=Persea americana TaxID=3435 RepID=A0ACC2MGX4_PERAE|nr:hypothetical protein MRB53_006364 [Persea americana]